MGSAYNKAGKISLIALIICIAFQACVSLIYYPKYKKSGTEAMISWDVSGYYFYLPAVFVYGDLKQVEWRDHIYERYGPGYDQTFEHPSGNRVMKYSSGMAAQYLPAFLLGHAYASVSSKYPADGFSRPYQLALNLWALLIAALGLYLLRLFLSGKLPDWGIALVLLTYVFGTNYLDYTAVHGAMSHNILFTYYAALLLASERFYRRPSMLTALVIGFCLGMMCLIRPTEIIAAILPLLYGVSGLAGLRERFGMLGREWKKYFAAAALTGAIGFIQLAYWKYVSGSWLVYSYEEQGFSWLSPHIYQGIFTFKTGWLVYTPVLALVFPGFVYLYKEQRKFFWPILLHTLLFIYIAFAWDIWWYGVSLGQRAMVQSYPVLALPFGLFLVAVWRNWGLIGRTLLPAFLLTCCTYNLWLHHHAHKGGLLECGNMSRAYFWHILGKSSIPVEGRKLLDTDELFQGEPAAMREVIYDDFEAAPADSTCQPLRGERSVCFAGAYGASLDWEFDASAIQPGDEWVRFEALFKCPQKEWNIWRMHRMMVRFYDGDKLVWERHIKIHRQLNDTEVKTVFIDTSLPPNEFTRVQCSILPEGSEKSLVIDNVRIALFRE